MPDDDGRCANILRHAGLTYQTFSSRRHLQNNPPLNVPQEDLASDHVMRAVSLPPFLPLCQRLAKMCSRTSFLERVARNGVCAISGR